MFGRLEKPCGLETSGQKKRRRKRKSSEISLQEQPKPSSMKHFQVKAFVGVMEDRFWQGSLTRRFVTIDSLRAMFGAEVIDSGVHSLVEIFQYPHINRHLFYVLVDLVVSQLLPELNMDDNCLYGNDFSTIDALPPFLKAHVDLYHNATQKSTPAAKSTSNRATDTTSYSASVDKKGALNYDENIDTLKPDFNLASKASSWGGTSKDKF
jgi:hypothetical protein